MKSLLHAVALAATLTLFLDATPARADEARSSAPALFNQANAEQRAGHFGPAILHYEQARLLAPRDATITQNLRVAREKARLPQMAVSAWRRPITSVSLDVLAVLVSICLLLLCVLLFGTRFLATTIRGLSMRVALGLGTVALFSASALAARWPELQRSVVLPDHAAARLAPAANAASECELKGGQLVSTVGEYGSFVRVRTMDGHTGWIGNAELAPIIPPAAHPSPM